MRYVRGELQRGTHRLDTAHLPDLTAPATRAEVAAWIADALAWHGVETDGAPAAPIVRPWSVVWPLPTTGGRAFFKATLPVFAHEPALTEQLGGWAAGCIPAVLAVDSARSWLLTADAGQPLRASIRPVRDLRAWESVLRRYAQLQIALVGRAGTLLALGVPDRRPRSLPALYDDLATDAAALMVGHAEGLTEEQHRAFVASAPGFAAACAELDALGPPPTLHHDDFHDGNIFVRDGRARFADWAEAAVAHPFTTLTVCLRGIAHAFVPPASPDEIDRLRAGYLEPWTALASARDLRRAAELAERVGRVVRALTWRTAVSALDGPERAEEAPSVPGWVRLYLESPPDD